MKKNKYAIVVSEVIAKIRPFIKPFLIVFAIYSVAMLSILRANYSYMDDAGRAIDGYAWTSDFNRVSSSILGFALNVNLRLSDISPLPQIIAILMLSVSSVVLMSVFCRGRVSYLPLISSCFIGLTPFMYGCWVFKFDAPCMALSILVSVVPLIFWNKFNRIKTTRGKLALFLFFALCMLVMWTSYQASSGVMAVFVVGLAMIDLLRGDKFCAVLKKAMFYCLAYLFSALLFKVLFPDIDGNAYRTTEVFSFSELLSGIGGNIGAVINAVVSSMNIYWRVLSMLVLICFGVFTVIFGAKRIGILKSLGVVISSVLLMAMLSYGAYLILKNAPTLGRSLVGVSAFMAVISMATFIFAERRSAVVFAGVCNILLLYSFVVYGLAFGNGLASQKDYADFRIQRLIDEMIDSNVDIANNKQKIRLFGDIGLSPVMQHVRELYPVTDRIFDMQSGLNDKSIWGYRTMLRYFGVDMLPDEEWEINCNKEISNSRYYNISMDASKNICVDIK